MSRPWWSRTTSAPGRSSWSRPSSTSPSPTPPSPRRTVADPGRRLRPGPAGLAAADPVGERAGAAGQHRGGHDRPARAGADPAVPVPADGPRRPAADRHARRHRAAGTGQDRRAGRRAAAARHPVEAVLRRQAANPRYLRDGDVITARSPPPTAGLDLGTQHNTIIGKTP
jgi:hypothetical protein